MQGNDFVQSTMYHRQMRCFDCHEVHNNDNPGLVIERGNALCLQCHAPNMQNAAGLRTTVSKHTHHAEGSKGSECVACHMPLIAQTIKDNYVASHTFRFITPSLTEQVNVPNPCTSCHKDKSNSWATEELKKWNTVSPWRMTGSTM
jgi:predicted CXXCH cytochrome family protein